MRKEKYIGLLVAVFVTMMMFSAIPAAGQEKEVYADRDMYNKATMTIYYGVKSNSGIGMSDWNWFKNDIQVVKFDRSMKNCKPSSCARWFQGYNKLYKIEGLTYLNTEDVTDMSYMFDGCSSLEILDLSNFNTNNVFYMNGMFNGCSSLKKLDLSSFNTGKVMNMQSMFNGCRKLYTIYVDENWTIKSVEQSCDKMFDGCSSLIGGNGMSYNAECIDKTYACIGNGYLTSLPKDLPYAVIENDVLIFKYGGNRPQGAYKINTIADEEWKCIQTIPSTTKIVFDESFKKYEPKTCRQWFYYKGAETIEGFENFNTANIKDMSEMFSECRNLTHLDLSELNTDNVTNMNRMFYSCEKLKTIIFNRSNTQKVEDMSSMFDGCTNLTNIDFSNFRANNLQKMHSMFEDCQNLTEIDLSNFNTSKVISMSRLFENCKKLKRVNLSGLDTREVQSMKNMFYECNNLVCLDLRSFDTRNVTEMTWTFYNCINLHTICVSDTWTMKSVKYGTSVFLNCHKLVGCKGTAYDSKSDNVNYAIIDGGTTAPGYLSTELLANTIWLSEYPKKEYYEGEDLDLSNGTLSITYEDGSTNTIPLSEANVTGFNSTIKDTDKYLTLTVEYQKQITFFDVTIQKLIVEKIEITKLPEKTEYVEGQKLDLKGGEATLKYNNGATEVIELSSNKITASGFNREAIGNQTISVSIGNCSVTFEVTVKEKTANDIILSQTPKNNYLVGQELDLSAGKIIVIYDNGTTSIIDFSSANISGYDPNKIGEQTVTVEYLGLKTEFTVTVNEKKEDSNNEPTPISEISASSDIKIWSADRTIYADNVVGNTGIRITDITGHLVKSIKATNDRMEIPMQTSGIYIVKIGTKTQKVIIQ